MIEDLKIQKLPYIDGLPDAGQANINWIKNGERLCAATTPKSNDGTLNRPTVQVQTNCLLLETNDNNITDKVNEVILVVNNINESLQQAGDNQIISLVNANNIRINELERVDRVTDLRVSVNEKDIADINARIGIKDPQDKTTRTMMGELFFHKREIGSYPGFNLDGLPDAANPGSGMKYRIAQTSLALANYDQRITKLEDEFVQSDVGNLTIQVDKLRSELGPSASATGINVYLRLTNAEKQVASNASDVDMLKSIVDFDNANPLHTRVSMLETDYGSLYDRTTGLKSRVGLLEQVVGDATKPGTLVAEIGRLDAADDTLFAIIGHSDSDGIRGQLADLNTKIGSESEPLSVLGRVQSVEDQANAINVEVSQLTQTVGTSSSGLVAASLLMSHDLYGNPGATDPLEVDGIKKTVETHDAELKTNVIKVPASALPYYVENKALTQFANIAVDLRALNKTVTLVNGTTRSAVPLTGAVTEVMRNAELADPSVKMKQAGNVKIDCAIEVTGVTDAAEYVTYIAVTNSDGSVLKRSITGLTAGSNGAVRFYILKGIVEVAADDLVTLAIGAADAASVGEITVNYVDLIVTPAL